MTDNQFLNLRRYIIREEFSSMNDKQFEAVVTVKGPVLVLAGAGSGKTTVLVNRIAYLVKYGNAYKCEDVPAFGSQTEEKLKEAAKTGNIFSLEDYLTVDPVAPYNILAITFTNKAANELKERIKNKLGEMSDGIWAGTFHSICGKILRRYAHLIGYDSNFTIYDTDDQKKVIKEIIKAGNYDSQFFNPKMVLGEISSAKDKLISPAQYKNDAGSDFKRSKIAQIYEEYSRILRDNNAMDFDDMIVNTVRLLKENDDVADFYRNKFRYIMVDEYQDTNIAQYVLVSTLAKGENNICVVGDDDQSIYRFRGATIENILGFEEEFEQTSVIKLEQNYRSTSVILDAANAVIKHNLGRKDKTLWTDRGMGESIEIYNAYDQQDEARYVLEKISESIRNGEKASSNAVLYRMNALSNAVENVFARSGFAYDVVGGLKFYDRKEIKDVLAYLQVINNPSDSVRIKRIINEPKRGIGDTTIDMVSEIASANKMSFYEVLKTAENFPPLSRSNGKIKAFVQLIEEMRTLSEVLPLSELVKTVIDRSGYLAALAMQGESERERIENVRELSSNIVQYELENEEPTLSSFLEEVALISDIDSLDEEKDKVVLMTIHSAKGLEFDNVYLIGMEEGVFPASQSIYAGESEIEEERRLAYVALTRAKNKLFISRALTRMLYGMTGRNAPSRFLNEIPKELCNVKGREDSYAYHSSAFDFERKSSFKITNSYTAPVKKETTNYEKGMIVEHNIFGIGKIEKTVPMGSDTLLEIRFDKVGLKKLMAGYAKLKIL